MSTDTLPDRVVRTARLSSRERYGLQIERRFFRLLNYLSIDVFVVVVYGAALGSDYLLFRAMMWLLEEDVRRYPPVAAWLDYARIGLALLFIFLAVVHGLISTIVQVRLDLLLTKEGEQEV